MVGVLVLGGGAGLGRLRILTLSCALGLKPCWKGLVARPVLGMPPFIWGVVTHSLLKGMPPVSGRR